MVAVEVREQDHVRRQEATDPKARSGQTSDRRRRECWRRLRHHAVNGRFRFVAPATMHKDVVKLMSDEMNRHGCCSVGLAVQGKRVKNPALGQPFTG